MRECGHRKTPPTLKWLNISIFLVFDKTVTRGQVDGRSGGRMSEQADGRTDARTDGWMDGQTDGGKDERAGGQTDGRTDGRTERQMLGLYTAWQR